MVWYRLYTLKLVERRIYHPDLSSSAGVQSCWGQTAAKYLHWCFSAYLKASFQNQTLARKVFMVLTQYFSGHEGQQKQEDPVSVDTPIPTGSCPTQTGNHLMFAALPWSTKLKWHFSWVGDCFWNLPGNKEVTNKGIYTFFLSSPAPLHVEAWKHLVPSFISV